MTTPDPSADGATLPSVRREFRWILAAAAQSLVGDQVARVALAVLVFGTTHSALATGAAYAATFLPAIATAFLGHLADRYPRRAVLVSCDLARVALVATMAIPAVPVWLVCVLLMIVVVFGGPFTAASSAILSDLFHGQRYRTAMRWRQVTGQLAQLVGFGLGGILVAAIGARWSLAADAGTYLVSAAILRTAIRFRPAIRPDAAAPLTVRSWGSVVATPRQWRYLGIIALPAFWIVPEALAAPYAAEIGGGSRSVGALLCALPAGFAAAALLWRRMPGMGPAGLSLVALSAGLPLLGFFAVPALPVAVGLLVLTGAATVCLPAVIADYIESVPPTHRGQASGLSSAVLLTAQGVGSVLGGALAQAWRPGPAVGTAGLLASLGAVSLLLLVVRVDRSPVRTAQRSDRQARAKLRAK